MSFFLIGGLVYWFDNTGTAVTSSPANAPFLSAGLGGLLGTVGFVFVSYAGLTKIASVAEEVENSGRNIPLGMILSIISITIIYVIGISLMNAVLPADVFRSSLTPVANSATFALGFLPEEWGVILVAASAVATFASTGNAGILAASRYPLAMGRDHLLPRRFTELTKRGTPLFSEESNFVTDWLEADDWHELKEILLHTEQLLTLWLTEGHPTETLINRHLKDVDWPSHILVVLVHRDGQELIPDGQMMLRAEDQIVIIGEEAGIDQLYKQYVSGSRMNILARGGNL